MHRHLALFVAFVLGIPSALAAQEGDWSYAQFPEAEEIALARSAAPVTVSAGAEIWVIREGRYEVAAPGTSGNACLVIRGGLAGSLLPVCYDLEAARTILPIELRKFELQKMGLPRSEVLDRIRQEIARGEHPMPMRPALSHMMSSGMKVRQPDDTIGPWRPHIMLYMPFITPQDLGLDPDSEHVMVVNGGQPLAFLMVLVPSFTDATVPSAPE